MRYLYFLSLLLLLVSFRMVEKEPCAVCSEKAISEWVPFGFHDILTENKFKCYGKPYSKWIAWTCECKNIYYEQEWCYKGKLKTLYYAERDCNCPAKRVKFKKGLNVVYAQECSCDTRVIAESN